MSENAIKVIQLQDNEGNDVSPVVNVGSIYDKNGQKVDNLLSYVVAGTDVPIPEIPSIASELQQQVDAKLDEVDTAVDNMESQVDEFLTNPGLPVHDVRTYPVREGQSISAGDVVNVGGSPETVYKNVVAQDNVENVILSSSVSATNICRINDLYSVLVFNGGATRLVSNENGTTVSSGSYGDSFTMKNPSICALSAAKAAVTYERTGNPFIDIISISGSSMSFAGEKGTIWENAKNGIVLCLSSTKLLYIANNGGLGVKIITVSGTTANYSASPVMLSSNTGANYISACKLPDDSNGNKRVCICFADTGDGNKGKAVIATIDSSNAVTFGDIATIYSSNFLTHNSLTMWDESTAVVVNYTVSNVVAKAFTIQDNIISQIGNEVTLTSLTTAGSYFPIIKVGDALVVIESIDGNSHCQLLRVSNNAIEVVQGFFSFNNSKFDYCSASNLDSNHFIIAYADGGNSNYGTTTILEVNGNQIAGSFIDNSQDAIALADGTGGQSIPVGFGGYCECPGVTEGETIDSPGVIAEAVQDGWLQIKNAWDKGHVVGTYTGDGTSNRLIDIGFTPTAVIVANRGDLGANDTGIDYSSAFGITGNPGIATTYGDGPILVKTTDNGFIVNTGFYNAGSGTNINNSLYYYIAWR